MVVLVNQRVTSVNSDYIRLKDGTRLETQNGVCTIGTPLIPCSLTSKPNMNTASFSRLQAVPSIDENGKALLQEIHQRYGTLVASGCLTKAIVKDVMSTDGKKGSLHYEK